LAVFNSDTATGKLSFSICFIDSKKGVTGLKSPTSVTVSPDNKNVYVTGSRENTIAIFNVMPGPTKSAACNIPIKQDACFSAFSKGRFTTIVFDAKTSGSFILSLLNSQGKLVKKVMNNYLTAGNHKVKADFSDVQNGIYFLSLANGFKTRAIKIVITKQE
jgi:DNA-binding beta-propeller fold protein YncE